MTHRHFADGAVEIQAEPLLPVDEEERFCFFLFPLFGTEAQFMAYAVFGAHQLPVAGIGELEGCILGTLAPIERQGM